MRVSFNQIFKKTHRHNGFGQARGCVEDSLKRLGHEVSFMDSTADVEINFIQPHRWEWSGVDYRIGYVPWESTWIRPEWLDPINNQVDELWVPSEWNKEIFEANGVQVPVKVFKHGVEKIWTPERRNWSDGPLEFFHHGAEALRKGGNELVFVHLMNFHNKRNARLTMKMLLEGFKMPDSPYMRVRDGVLDIDELIALYKEQHAMVYPSWGEGFGLAPLQFMATGGPVLITKGWAPYEDLLPEELIVNATLTDVPTGQQDWPYTQEDWRHWHPGQMWQPDMDDLRDKMINLYDNYDKYAQFAYYLTTKVAEEYDWDTLTEDAFKHLTD